MIAVDLFSGAGGFSLGLERAGVHIVGALDAWGPAVETYRRNFRHPIVHADALEISPAEFCRRIGVRPGDIDLVVGGPPCQGFSIQRIGDDSDDRNDLVLRFAQFIEAIRPRMFLMENVLGLLGRRGRRYAERFESYMRQAGYYVHHRRVNAAEYGVPQARKRVIFFGWLGGQVPPLVFPVPSREPGQFRTVQDAIGDLPSPPDDFTAPPEDPLHRRTRMSQKNLERLRLVPPGGGFEDLPVELRVDCHKSGADRIGHRAVYGRLDPDKPAATITARFDSFTRGRFAHPFEHRNITLREGARLQTFPDDFIVVGTQEEIAAQIGNAVPPQLAEVIGLAVRRSLLDEPLPGAPQTYDAAGTDRPQIDMFATTAGDA